MDAVEKQAWQAPIFHKSRLLYLFCVDPDYVSELTVPSLPFLKIKCLFGHVSFPGFLSERRMVVFPKCKRILEKMKGIDSPCLIEVTSSVEYQVRIANFNQCFCCLFLTTSNSNVWHFQPTLNELEFQIHSDEVEDDVAIMLIWGFKVDTLNASLIAANFLVKAEIPSSVNTI